MTTSLNTATGGLLAASQSFDQAAARVAKAGANTVEHVAAPSITSAAPKGDDVKNVVELTRAEANYDAKAEAMETVNNLVGEILDVLA